VTHQVTRPVSLGQPFEPNGLGRRRWPRSNARSRALFCHASQPRRDGRPGFRDFLRRGVRSTPAAGRGACSSPKRSGGSRWPSTAPARVTSPRSGPALHLHAWARRHDPRHSDLGPPGRGTAIVAAPIAATIVPTSAGAELLGGAHEGARAPGKPRIWLQPACSARVGGVGTRRRDEAVTRWRPPSAPESEDDAEHRCDVRHGEARFGCSGRDLGSHRAIVPALPAHEGSARLSAVALSGPVAGGLLETPDGVLLVPQSTPAAASKTGARPEE